MLFLIAASQVEAVADSLPVLSAIFIACIPFLVGAVICGVAIGKAFNLPVAQARTLVFTLTTRNSFVVLPFALALPAAWEMTAITIVFPVADRALRHAGAVVAGAKKAAAAFLTIRSALVPLREGFRPADRVRDLDAPRVAVEIVQPSATSRPISDKSTSSSFSSPATTASQPGFARS